MRTQRMSMAMRAAVAAALVSWSAAGPLRATQNPEPTRAAGRPIPHVDDFRHDGRVSEWRARPIDRILPATGRIPQALLWVGQVEEGLVVAAEIRSGVEPDEDATLAIGLRGAGDVEMPPVGWGHQFGFVTLTDAADCAGREFGEDDPAACEAWYARQLDYRDALSPLFERAWRLRLTRPDSISEAVAGPSFDRLPETVRSAIAPLEPRGAPGALTRPIVGTEGGLGVEVLIPWSAFPPVRAPDLETVHLSLDWLGPGAQGGPSGAPGRALARPLRHRVTPCGYAVGSALIPGGENRFSRRASDGAVAYMTPEASGDLRRLIVLDNHAEGYLYDPTADTWSPSAFEPAYDVLDVGRGQRICTPVLAFAPSSGDAGRREADAAGAGEEDGYSMQVDPRELEVRREDDGDLMVKSGSRVVWSYYGAGQCGGCPRVGLDLFHVDVERGRITPAFRFLEVAEPTVRDIEIEVSDDWESITVFRSRPRFVGDRMEIDWDLERFCMETTPRDLPAFAACGAETDVAEPPDRLRRRYATDPPE